MSVMLAGILPFLVALLILASPSTSMAEEWSLEKTLRFATEHNPDIRVAVARIEGAKAQLTQANSAFWPQLRASSSYSRSDNPQQVFGSALLQRSFSPTLNFNDVPDADNWNSRLGVVIPLYAGGAHVAAKAAAASNLTMNETAADAARQAIQFEVARAYLTAQRAREFVAVATETVTAFERNVELATKQVMAGAALKTDQLDLEVKLAESREQRAIADNNSKLAVEYLKSVIGFEQGEITLSANNTPPSLPERVSVRPEVKAAESAIEAARAEIRKSRAGYLPQLNAVSGVEYNRGWEFDGDGTNYIAGVTAEWSIWDGQLTTGRVSEAQAALMQAEAHKRKVELQAKLELERARLNLQEAEERLRVSERAVEQAKESVELTRSRYIEGAALITQLIDSELALSSAKFRRSDAVANRLIAIAALRWASGLGQISE